MNRAARARLAGFAVAAMIVTTLAVSSSAASAAAPTITGFTPPSGTPATAVTITGTALTGATQVKFKTAAAASYHVDSATQITAVVPASAVTGKISVTTPGGTATSATNFTVVPVPKVTLSPPNGPPTTTTSVSGTLLGVTEAVDLFYDTTPVAVAVTDSAGSFGPLSITVPASAQPGVHWITAVGRHSGIAAQTPFTVRTDWTQWQWNGRHLGANPYENTLNADNLTQLDIVWRKNLPAAAAAASSVLSGGTLFVPIASPGSLLAMEATTGAVKWNAPVDSLVRSTPIVVGNTVVIAGVGGAVEGLDPATGAVRWHEVIGSVHTAPAAANGVVFYNDASGTMYALNAKTGAYLWAYPTGNTTLSSPTTDGTFVYATGSDGNVFSLTFDGTEAHTSNLGVNLIGSPMTFNGRLWQQADQKTTCDMSAFYLDGQPLGAGFFATHTNSAGGCIGNSPAIFSKNTLYGFDASAVAFPYNTKQGGSWTNSTALTQLVVPDGAGPTAANGVVYVPVSTCDSVCEGAVIAFDASTGDVLYTHISLQPVVSSPIVADGSIYETTQNAVYKLALGNDGPSAVRRPDLQRPDPHRLEAAASSARVAGARHH